MPATQDMYDKQRGKKRGAGSDADSDGGQIGFGSSRAKKAIMSDEQVPCCILPTFVPLSSG